MGASYQPVGKQAERKRASEISCADFFMYAFAAVMVVGCLVAVTASYDSSLTPIYSATITAVTGLDPDTDLLLQQSPSPGTFSLSPVFNLTVGVASDSRMQGACIGAGTAVKVSYSHLRLPMASGHVPAVCVGPRESRVLRSLVASGRDVAVPGFLMDSLADEMRTGEAMFEVELIKSDESGWWSVAKGWGKVGDTLRLTHG